MKYLVLCPYCGYPNEGDVPLLSKGKEVDVKCGDCQKFVVRFSEVNINSQEPTKD